MGAPARRRNDERTRVSRRGDDGPIADPTAARPGAAVPAGWIARLAAGPAAAWGIGRAAARHFPDLARPGPWPLSVAGSATRTAMGCAAGSIAASLPGRRSRHTAWRIPALAPPSPLAMVGCRCGRCGGDGTGDHTGRPRQPRFKDGIDVRGALVHPSLCLEQARADIIGSGHLAGGPGARRRGAAEPVSVCRAGQRHTPPCADEPA